MNTTITSTQVEFYQGNGYLIIEDFLSNNELEKWRDRITEALNERKGQKIPGKEG